MVSRYWTQNENEVSHVLFCIDDSAAYKLRIFHMCRQKKKKKSLKGERKGWGDVVQTHQYIFTSKSGLQLPIVLRREPISCRARISNRTAGWYEVMTGRWLTGWEDVSCAVRSGSSDWPGPAASSWGAVHACSEGSGRPAAGSGRASVVPGTALQTCGLWWLDLRGPGSSQHLLDSYTWMRERR